MKRFIEKGTERLDEDLDLMILIKLHKKHHKIINNELLQSKHLHVNDDSLDIDNSSDESEEKQDGHFG